MNRGETTRAMEKEVSCQNFVGLMTYLHNHYGEEGVRECVRGLADNRQYLVADKFDPSKVSTVQLHHLLDPAYWVSYEFCLALFANAKRVLRGDDPLFTAGEGAAEESFSRTALVICRIFGIKFLAKQVARLNARFNRTKDVRLTELTSGSALFELSYHPKHKVSKDICDWNRGVYTGITKMTGATGVKCEELRCAAEGDEHCLFRLTWKETNFAKRILRGMMRFAFKDLLEDYETALKDREELIHRLTCSERQYRLLAENLSDVIWTSDMDLHITYVSPSVERARGYTAEEAMAQKAEEALAPESLALALDVLAEETALENTPGSDPFRTRTMELEYGCKDGTSCWSEVKVSFLRDPDGKAVGILGVGRDISMRRRAEEERKTLERHLRQAQKMEAIATLAGGIAHRFNNALTVITANLDLMEMDFAAEEGVVKAMQSMRDSALQMAGLTGQLLAYARGGKYRARVIPLGDFVRDTLPLLEHTLRPGISVETHLPGDTRHIRADVIQLQMVLSALLANASEAMETGGRIRIACGNQTVGREAAALHPGLVPGDYVVLSVEDTGKGMDEDTRSRVFEPFYTTKLVGSGLGMAAVYGIVKNHGGWIQVESAPGRGTLVRILLPAAEKAPEGIREKGEAPKGSGTILLVEDEKAVSDSTRELLERLGYSVLTAATGREALDLAKTYEGDIDLVLLDILLPDMQGKDIYPRLMERRPGLKVIVCSGYFSDGPVQDLLKAGAKAFVEKPFRLGDLSERISKALKPDS